jgi:hypothetical protein
MVGSAAIIFIFYNRNAGFTHVAGQALADHFTIRPENGFQFAMIDTHCRWDEAVFDGITEQDDAAFGRDHVSNLSCDHTQQGVEMIKPADVVAHIDQRREGAPILIRRRSMGTSIRSGIRRF